jgi:hypothetical protein
MAIGARGGDLAGDFRGAIDEISIYNRALSTDEIRGIFNAGSAGKCPGITNAAVFTVNAQSGPWQCNNVDLNSNFQYGVGDQLAPTIITNISGTPVAAGEPITLTYLSGEISSAPYGGPPVNSYVDANGVLGAPNPGTTSWPNIHGHFPSFYMNESQSSPKYPTELVGTFANSQGEIVGTLLLWGTAQPFWLCRLEPAKCSLG